MMKNMFWAICLTALMLPAAAWADANKRQFYNPDIKGQLSPQQIKELTKERSDLIKRADRGASRDLVDLAYSMEQMNFLYPIDRAKAYELYQKAADKGDRFSKQKTCIAYLLGEGQSKSIVTAMPYCNSLGIKDPTGLFALAYDYQNGLSGPKDEEMAIGLYIQAVDLGSAEACDALGQKALAQGKPEAARQWFKRGSLWVRLMPWTIWRS